MIPEDFRATLRCSGTELDNAVKKYQQSLRNYPKNCDLESAPHGKPVPPGYSSYYQPESVRQSDEFRRQRSLNSSALTQGFEL